jgi:cytochrome c-type biogenesis protein
VLALTLGALVAGVLTTLAPCVLPLLPVIVGGSVAPAGRAAAHPTSPAGATTAGATTAGATTAGATTGGAGPATTTAPVVLSDRRRAMVIAGSLALSVMLFTVALRASTALIDIPPETWTGVSGGLLIALGLVQLFPAVWERVATWLGLAARSNRLIRPDRATRGWVGAALTGAALGPVFSSCSPLYAYVVATVLPTSWPRGMVLLTAYVVGLAGTLLLVALLGQRAVRRLRAAADPHGWLRRVVGLLFVLVGLAVLTGTDRDLQTWLVQNGPLAGVWTFDQTFIPR